MLLGPNDGSARRFPRSQRRQTLANICALKQVRILVVIAARHVLNVDYPIFASGHCLMEGWRAVFRCVHERSRQCHWVRDCLIQLHAEYVLLLLGLCRFSKRRLQRLQQLFQCLLLFFMLPALCV